MKAVRDQEVRTRIGGQEFRLLFPMTNVPPETKVVIATDIQLVLAGIEKASFSEIADNNRPRYVEQYQTAVTHRLNLDNQERWLPKALRGHLGMAVKAGDTFHLIIPQVVLDAYKKALEMKKRDPVMFSRVDDLLAKLQDAEKRREIAHDPLKARQMFYFHMMKPWDEDRYYSKNLLPAFTIRRPSLLEFTSLGVLLRDTSAPDIPAFLTLLRAENDGKEYVEKWPPFVYVDGQWRILVISMP
jgi:hypothetical protein